MSAVGGTPLHYELEVEPTASGERLDVWLSRQPFARSRSFVKRLIEEGRVRLVCEGEGATGKNAAKRSEKALARHRVAAGERFWVEVPPPEPMGAYPEAISLDIVYEDADMAVVNKPRGMVVHAGAGHHDGTLVNALLAHCGHLSTIGGKVRPGIVHRLDKETTGLLVVAKNDVAHISLAKQIQDRSLSRHYLAIVRGEIPNEHGRIEANVGRHPVHRKRMAVLREGGRPAVTHFSVIERLCGYTLLELRLETGRTHQIRVHMAHVGFPVAGDPVYGPGTRKGKARRVVSRDGRHTRSGLGLTAQALHAWRLGLTHPRTGEWVQFLTPPPSDFLAALSALGSERAEALSKADRLGEKGSR